MSHVQNSSFFFNKHFGPPAHAMMMFPSYVSHIFDAVHLDILSLNPDDGSAVLTEYAIVLGVDAQILQQIGNDQ